MMLCRVVLVSIGLGAQAYAPIQMVSHGIKGLAVLPEGFPRHVQDSVTPQTLVISNAIDSIPPSRIPYFTARPDQTITWDDMDWCLEAAGGQRGAIARVNKCNGGAAQKWNWIPNGQGSNMLQLQDTRMCLDVRDGYGLDGAPIVLRACENSVTETWAFEDVMPGISGSAARASDMRHVMLSLFALAGVSLLGVSAWLTRSNAKRHAVALSMDQMGGVALTTPTRISNISMLEEPKAVEESALAAPPALEVERGSTVRVMQNESYSFQDCGTAVTIAKDGGRYPATVRFEKSNYGGVSTNNSALGELVAVSGPKPKEAKARASDTAMMAAVKDDSAASGRSGNVSMILSDEHDVHDSKVNDYMQAVGSAVVAAGLGLAIGMVAPQVALAADIGDGERIFSRNCAACHAGGMNVIYPDKSLDAAAIKLYLDGGLNTQSIAYQVANGKNAMPAFGGRLSEDEIQNVAAYVFQQTTDAKWDFKEAIARDR